MKRVSAAPSLALALAFALAPRPVAAQDADPWFGPDKLLHFTASAGIAGVGYGVGAALWEPAAPRLCLGAGLALGLGVAKELYDLAGSGDASARDLAWDLLGTGTGLLVAWVIDRLLTPAPGARAPRAPVSSGAR